MNIRRLTRIPSPIAIVLAAIALTGGCNRPAWERKSGERRERIDQNVSGYAEYDAAGTERMDTTLNRMENRRGYHEEHLEKTSSLVRKEMESDERRWREERPKRRAFASRQWHAKPETIPGTWAKMVY